MTAVIAALRYPHAFDVTESMFAEIDATMHPEAGARQRLQRRYDGRDANPRVVEAMAECNGRRRYWRKKRLK